MQRAAWLVPLLAMGCTSKPADRVTAQGTIEVEETDIVPRVGGRISRIWVAEGAMVHAGDTVVTLVSATLPEDLRGREAKVATAEAQLRDLERGARPEELSRAEADLRAAQAEDARAAREQGRMEMLGATNAVAQRDVDEARATASQARESREAAEQTLRLLRAGATREAIAAARSRLAEARAFLAQGHATTSELTLLAPADGVVLPHYRRVGEVVDDGDAVMTTADVARPWVRVFVNQRAVPALRVGASAEAVLDGDPTHPVVGRIVAINHKAEYTPRVALTTEERADLMFGIKVALVNSTGAAQAGLPATIRLSLASGATEVAEARP